MKLTLLLTPDGKLLVSVPEGTFQEARAAIEAVLRDLVRLIVSSGPP